MPGEPARERAGVLAFPVVGGKLKEWHLTDAKLAEYAASYPGVDALAECRAARQWCVDNPKKRKTAAGMPRFLSAWLCRKQEGGRGAKAREAKPAGRTLAEKLREEQCRRNGRAGPSGTAGSSG